MIYILFLTTFTVYFFQFVNNLVATCTEKETAQPSIEDIKAAILHFAGPVVTFRAFKQGAPRAVRSTCQQEFVTAAGHLTSFGQVVSVRIPRQPRPTNIFVKAKPDTINWNVPLLPCKQDDYTSKYVLPVHSSIGAAIKTALVNNGHICQEVFNN